MYLLWKGNKNHTLPAIPVYVDSPMGNRVLDVFQRFVPWQKLSSSEFQDMVDYAHVVTSYEETWEIIHQEGPRIILAGSGMVTGGRVLSYLQKLIDLPTTRVLLVGFQAEGTRGRQLKEGAREIKIRGTYIDVQAEIHCIESLSAHADQADLLDWMSDIDPAPEHVCIIHGETLAQETLAQEITRRYGWPVSIPTLREVVKFPV